MSKSPLKPYQIINNMTFSPFFFFSYLILTQVLRRVQKMRGNPVTVDQTLQ